MIGDVAPSGTGRPIWRDFGRCFALCLAVALAATLAFRLPVGVVLLGLLLLGCPIAGLWAYGRSSRPLPVPLGPAPRTRAHTLNWLAPWYDGWCERLGLGPKFRIHTIELAAVRTGDRVLDIGCGTGALTRLAARVAGAGGSVLGIDAAPDMVRVAREKAAGADVRPRFELAAAEALPLPSGAFDVVLASLVLHALPGPVLMAALREVRRVLKPDGHLLVAEFDRPQGAPAWFVAMVLGVSPLMRRHIRGQTGPLLHAAGFEPVSLGKWGGLIAIWSATPVPLSVTRHG